MTSVAAGDTPEHNELWWMFLRSEFAGDHYANWPIERRIDAYLRHRSQLDVLNDGAAYGSLLDLVMANVGKANRSNTIEPDVHTIVGRST